MRNYFIHISLLLALVMLLTGCGAAKPAERATVPPAINDFTRDTTPPETQPETVPVETDIPAVPEEIPATDPIHKEPQAPVETSGELPYLQQIERFDHSIYHGPGYDYGFVDTIPKGIYTIVEEAVDAEGNLWGKLKSGIGWINLTEIRSADAENALISANYADNDLLNKGVYHLYASGDEYAIPIAFRAYGRLQNVTLFDIQFNADGYFPGEDFFILEEMTEEMPLVAELAFPGDITTYGIRFTDEAGDNHAYTIYISGRNGALMLKEE
ncbi:MAG: hypothetical protein IKU68_04645 [Oscillospiraceae bacterium]|nr:hypothetical protein [Oscillospiraceae bacterium]